MTVTTTMHPVDGSNAESRRPEDFGASSERGVRCQARLFSALGDPTRLTILRALSANKTLCVSELAETTNLSFSAVSHQLRLLRDRELISARRSGRTVWYTISDDHVLMLLEVGSEHALQDCLKGRVLD